MIPGLKRSLASRAAASKCARSASGQRINCRAVLREIGTPGWSSSSAEAISEPLPRAAAEMELTVTLESNDTTGSHGNVGGYVSSSLQSAATSYDGM